MNKLYFYNPYKKDRVKIKENDKIHLKYNGMQGIREKSKRFQFKKEITVYGRKEKITSIHYDIKRKEFCQICSIDLGDKYTLVFTKKNMYRVCNTCGLKLVKEE